MAKPCKPVINKYPPIPCPCPEIPGPKGDTGAQGVPGPGVVSRFGHAYTPLTTGSILQNASIPWSTLQLFSGISHPNPTELTVSTSGIYQVVFTLNFGPSQVP